MNARVPDVYLSCSVMGSAEGGFFLLLENAFNFFLTLFFRFHPALPGVEGTPDPQWVVGCQPTPQPPPPRGLEEAGVGHLMAGSPLARAAIDPRSRHISPVVCTVLPSFFSRPRILRTPSLTPRLNTNGRGLWKFLRYKSCVEKLRPKNHELIISFFLHNLQFLLPYTTRENTPNPFGNF